MYPVILEIGLPAPDAEGGRCPYGRSAEGLARRVRELQAARCGRELPSRRAERRGRGAHRVARAERPR